MKYLITLVIVAIAGSAIYFSQDYRGCKEVYRGEAFETAYVCKDKTIYIPK